MEELRKQLEDMGFKIDIQRGYLPTITRINNESDNFEFFIPDVIKNEDDILLSFPTESFYDPRFSVGEIKKIFEIIGKYVDIIIKEEQKVNMEEK